MNSRGTGALIPRIIISIFVIFLLLYNNNTESHFSPLDKGIRVNDMDILNKGKVIGIIEKNDTIYDLFVKNNLDTGNIGKIYRSSRRAFNLKKIKPGRSYILAFNKTERTIEELKYSIDDLSYLHIKREGNTFHVDIRNVEYDRRYGYITGVIEDNLYSALCLNEEYVKIAYDLADIFAWDIDFSTDLRKGDSFKIIIEELWIGRAFKGFGNIISAEFINNGKRTEAYRFEYDHYAGYFDGEGRSLRKTLLRAPLKFRYVSSKFSKKRLHPILRVYRPHLGVDYVAPSGTPVSAAGDGKVIFAGYRGQNGKLLQIKHKGGYTTYYGHLRRFARNIKKDGMVKQGQIIGYVGKTGLATGPHLDYRIKYRGKFVNPLTVYLPREVSVPEYLRGEFMFFRNEMQMNLNSIDLREFAAVSTIVDTVSYQIPGTENSWKSMM